MISDSISNFQSRFYGYKKKVYMDVLITRINKMNNYNKIIIFEIVSSSECYSALL